MENTQEYHLHKNDLSRLHFEMNEAKPYCDTNVEHCFKSHRHSFYQIIWFKSAGRHYVDYQAYEHPENTLFFINKNQVHRFCTDSKNEGILFHFDDVFISSYDKKVENRFLYSLFSGVGDIHIGLNLSDKARVASLSDILQQELAEKKKDFQLEIFLIFHALLLFLERTKVGSEVESKHVTDPLFHIAVQFKIEVNAHLPIFKPLDYYYDVLNVTSKKLASASKKYLKDTPNNIIHKEKLLEAKRLLLNSSLTIQEVAYSLGYDQSTYFTKVFKSFFNMTPKEFKAIIS